MRESTIPGPVRVALAVDGGIAAVYATARVVGVPHGRLGTAVVGGEAAVWAAVVLAWVFPAFWSRWSASVERLFLGATVSGDERPPAPLAAWPSLRSQVLGAATLSVLLVVQAVTTSGATVPFRSVVAAYVVAAGIGAAVLAVAADVTSLLAATRIDE